jgi:cysteine desulfurase
MSVYLDYNATAKVRPQAIDAALKALELGANASSVHGPGRAARAMIEDAREAVAALAGVVAGTVTFTSGGTEANGLAIGSAVRAAVRRIILLATEHDSIVEAARASGLRLQTWPVDGEGLADLAWLVRALAEGEPALVCLALANNETGVIQPVAAVAALTRPAGAWLHVDAVQAAGKIAFDFNDLGADTLSLSGHKIGGPQGAGALIASPRITLTRLQHGGGHERGRRAGTENLPGIAGFGAAARAADPQALAGQAAWRDEVAVQLKAAGAEVLAESAPRLPQTLSFAAPGFSSETQVMALDLGGYAVSAGAACSSGKVTASRVVAVMGREDLAPYALRVSGGWATTQQDWQGFAEAWLQAHARVASRKVA